MADKNKSIEDKEIIDEAILDMNLIEETLNANTKEILRSIAKEEIEELVKESLNEDEDDYDEEDVDAIDTDAEEVPTDGEEIPTGGADDADDYVDTEVEPEAIGDELAGSEEDYPMGGEEGMEDEMSDYGDTMDMTDAGSEELIQVYKKLDVNDEIEIVSNENGDIELKVDQPGEFVIKVADESGEAPIEEPMGMPMDDSGEEGIEEPIGAPMDDSGEEAIEEPMDDAMGDAMGDTEDEYETEDEVYEEGVDLTNESEVVYEIALEEMENIDSVKAPVGNENEDNWAGDNLEGGFIEDAGNGGDSHAPHIMEDEEVTESEDEISEEVIDEEAEPIEEKIQVGKSQTVANNQTDIAGAGAITNKVKVGGSKHESYVRKGDYDTLKEAYDNIVKQNVEVKENLTKFRKMLGETVVFNTNLTNVTRLFTEHSTTKEEKKQIINRFDDEVSSIKESKNLFKTIEKELGSRAPLNETVENKISQTVNSGASAELNEAQTYVDRDAQRIIGLMDRVSNPDKFI